MMLQWWKNNSMWLPLSAIRWTARVRLQSWLKRINLAWLALRHLCTESRSRSAVKDPVAMQQTRPLRAPARSLAWAELLKVIVLASSKVKILAWWTLVASTRASLTMPQAATMWLQPRLFSLMAAKQSSFVTARASARAMKALNWASCVKAQTTLIKRWWRSVGAPSTKAWLSHTNRQTCSDLMNLSLPASFRTIRSYRNILAISLTSRFFRDPSHRLSSLLLGWKTLTIWSCRPSASQLLARMLTLI